MQAGVCVPQECSASDLLNASTPIYGEFLRFQSPLILGWLTTGDLVDAEVSCGDDAVEWDAASKAALTLLVFLVVVVMVSSVYHYRLHHTRNNIKYREFSVAPLHHARTLSFQVFECFSLTHSVPALLRVTPTAPLASPAPSDSNYPPAAATLTTPLLYMTTLNGVRVLSMSLVILGHTMPFDAVVMNPGALVSSVTSWQFQAVGSSSFAVDTFLLLSGLLAMHVLVKELRKLFPQAGESTSAANNLNGAGAALQVMVVPPWRAGETTPLLPTFLHVSSSETATGTDVTTAPGPALRQHWWKPFQKLFRFYVYAVVHRYLRLTVVLGFVVLMYTSLFPHIGAGPLWFKASADAAPCRQYWWTNLLYINTYVPETEEGCMAWTWYLSVDTQLFLFAPLFAALFVWRPRVALATVVATLLAQIVVTEEIVRQNGLTMLFTIDRDVIQVYWQHYYTKFWTRGGPYLIGVSLSFYLSWPAEEGAASSSAGSSTGTAARVSSQVCKFAGLNLFTKGLVFATILTVLGVLFYAPTSDYISAWTTSWSTAQVCLYTAFSRPVWAAAVAALLQLCISGQMPWLNRMLSWSLFEPLSRLTYGAYLLHPIIIQYLLFTDLALPTYSSSWVASHYIAHTVLAYVAAALLFLFVEFPATAIDKLFFGR